MHFRLTRPSTRTSSRLAVQHASLIAQLTHCVSAFVGVRNCDATAGRSHGDIVDFLYDVAPQFVGEGWQTVAGPARHPQRVAIEHVVRGRIVGDGETRSHSGSHL